MIHLIAHLFRRNDLAAITWRDPLTDMDYTGLQCRGCGRVSNVRRVME